jgi:hypothetical protein
MLIKRPEIDLPPKDWQSDREKPREPIFGRGAPYFLAELAITAGALGLLLVVLLAAGSVRERAYGVMFGEPQLSQPLKPGESVVIDGYKIKRID